MTINVFVPRVRFISSITNAQRCVVTFTEAHDFIVDEIISFRVTKPYGMYEVNNLRAKVLNYDTYTVTTDLDTLFFNAFIYPVSGKTTPPVCVPVSSGIDNTNNYFVFPILSDAFDNVRVS